jgi:hypothetical protein
MSAKHGKTVQDNGSFVMVRIAMKRSFAWRAMPDNARRLIDRLEVEHMDHGGTRNGRLVCTYGDFSQWGIRRASIALAIRQAIALGFVEVTRAGYKSAGEFKVPSYYRLTYVWGRVPGERGLAARQDPTDEWEKLDSAEKALAALRSAARPAGQGARKASERGTALAA